MEKTSTNQIKWPADGTYVGFTENENLVYRTPAINEFLKNDNYLFLSANKGMGKTLLMSYKRYLMQKSHPSAIYLPNSRPYLDNMALVNDVSKKMQDYLTDKKIISIWTFGICLSILSNLEIEDDELTQFSNLPKAYLELLKGKKTVDATAIFKELIESSPNEVEKVLHFGIVEKYVKQLNLDVRVFIDRVDQALVDLNKRLWISIQSCLLEAIHEIRQSNPHIKIYATIRNEAFATYSSGNWTLIYGSGIQLKYNDNELIELLNTLVKGYENLSSFNEFVGSENVTGNLFEESFFNLLVRHTLYRPRDIVRICAELSLKNSKSRDEMIDTVREVASTQIIPHVLQESIVFLESLREPTRKVRLFSLINANIFKFDDILDIYSEMNEMSRASIGQLELENENYFHPFSELYSVGLLGIIVEGKIKFRMPSDLQSFNSIKLPQSPYYVIHPALRNYINLYTQSYNQYKFIITGHNVPWNQSLNEYLITIQKLLNQIDNQELKDEIMEKITQNLNHIKTHHKLPFEDDLIKLLKRVESLMDELLLYGDEEKAILLTDLYEVLYKSKPVESVSK